MNKAENYDGFRLSCKNKHNDIVEYLLETF